MKTQESRFQVHDELTAPERSLPVLKGALAGGRPALELPRRARRLAGGAARLRALPLRAAPRHAAAQDAAADRARGRRAPGQRVRAHTLQRTARDAGLGLDEIALAREFDSARRARGGAAALRQGAARDRRRRRRCTSTRRRARRAGPTSRSSRRSRTWRSRTFTNLVTRAGDVPRRRLGRGRAPLQAA